MKDTFVRTSRETLLSKYLLAQLWITIVVGGSFLLSPSSPLANPAELGGETAALAVTRHLFGSNAVFSLCPALFVLQSAADRGRAGASTFRNLFVGAGLSTGLVTLYTFFIVLMIPQIVGGAAIADETQLPNLVSALAISTGQSLFYLYNGLKRGS